MWPGRCSSASPISSARSPGRRGSTWSMRLPKTRSGKLLRRSLQALVQHTDPGDLSTLDDPGALDEVRKALERGPDLGAADRSVACNKNGTASRPVFVARTGRSGRFGLGDLVLRLPPAGGSGDRRRSARRWSPGPIAMTICLYGTVVASPAANTPGTEVSPRSSIDDLAARRQLHRALQPLGVGQQADLHEDAFQLDRVRCRR